ncbi:MAG: DUF4118 domain-containing protein, partial [Hydrogenophaga sp.]|nr:DUF4118 domain-containing protein [Hydrogenophaga sp.]
MTRWRGLWRTLAVLLVCTAVGELIFPYLHPINHILVYLVGIVYLALREDTRWALAAVPMALLVYSWLFVAPRWSVIPSDPQYLLTFGIALIVSIVVSRLASRARQTADEATAAAGRAHALSAFAQDLAHADTEADIGTLLTSAARAHTGCEATLHRAPAPAGDARTLDLPLQAGGESQGWLRLQGGAAPALAPADHELVAAMAQQAAMALSRREFAQRHLNAALQAEAERVRSTLLASISHDFRTPLTTIIGAASTVLEQADQVPPARQTALITRVLEQARRLQALGSDLLELARLEGGAVRPQPEWVPADDLVREAIAPLLDALPPHPLNLPLADDTTAWSDMRLCSQAIANLRLNPPQHAPPGGRRGCRVVPDPGARGLRLRPPGR